MKQIKEVWVILLVLLFVGGFSAQTEEQLLQEAIQVIRNFVGDQSLTPLFTGEESRCWFEGPYRIFRFSWVPGYYYIKVRVAPSPICVSSWCKTDETWLPYVNTDLPEMSDDELLALARDYASQHFPGWNDFPYWQGKIAARIKASGYGKTVRVRIVAFHPYFVNDKGDKIMFTPASISIGIEPHRGNVISFSWHYNLKMTLSKNQINPTLSPLEAEAIAEEKVRDWVAQQLAEVGYSIPNNIVFEAILSDPNDPDQGWWGDSRLVLGATETSGLRLAYRIDKIQAKDVNTGEVLEEWFYAVIDAHTGEVLVYPERLSGLPESNNLSIERLSLTSIIYRFKVWIFVLGTFLGFVFFSVLLYRRTKRSNHGRRLS